MKVTRTAGDGGVRITVAGEVDIDSAPKMRQALDAALAVGDPIVVDLAAVTFMDSSGLSVLIAAHLRARDRGLELRLRDVPSRVAALLRVSGLDNVLVIADPSDPGN